MINKFPCSTSPTVVIPLTKVNVKALNEESQVEIKKEMASTDNNTPASRPRRSVTRKSAASEEATTTTTKT